MTALDIVVVCAIVGMFVSAALLIVKGGKPEAHDNLETSLNAVRNKRFDDFN